MDGIHDLGGRQGFGPVEVEPDEPVFHDAWEGRTFGVAAGALGAAGFNTAMFRHAIERMAPAHYLSSGYYEHWLTAVTTLLVEGGVVHRDELEARAGEFPLSQPALVSHDEAATGEGSEAHEFVVGDHVRVRDVRFAGHTRCPDFVRGRRGVIVTTEPLAPIPEREAHRNERVLEATYGVRFDARELWGDAAEPNNVVHVDLYAHYLEGA